MLPLRTGLRIGSLVFDQLALCLFEQRVPFLLVVGLIKREERLLFANEPVIVEEDVQ